MLNPNPKSKYKSHIILLNLTNKAQSLVKYCADLGKCQCNHAHIMPVACQRIDCTTIYLQCLHFCQSVTVLPKKTQIIINIIIQILNTIFLGLCSWVLHRSIVTLPFLIIVPSNEFGGLNIQEKSQSVAHMSCVWNVWTLLELQWPNGITPPAKDNQSHT